MPTLTFTPAQWTLIDMASQYGLDKELYEERLQFGREVLEELQGINYSDLSEVEAYFKPYIDGADAPEMFAKAMIAVIDILDGRPSGHMIGMDMSNSGPSLLSIACRCETGMRNVGAINTGSVPDLYSRVFENMESEKKITRTQVKKATVPYVYGSDVMPVNVFAEEAPMFEEAYRNAVPWAAWCRQTLINTWNSNALAHTWELVDGFVAHNLVMDKKDSVGSFKGVKFTYRHTVNVAKKAGKGGTKANAANVTHSLDAYLVREVGHRCNYNPRTLRLAVQAIQEVISGKPQIGTDLQLKRLQDLSLRHEMVSLEVVNHIESGMLSDIDFDYLVEVMDLCLDTLKYEPFQTRWIHDESACSPNHIERMRKHLNQVLADIYKGSWLFNVIEDLSGISYHKYREPFKQETYNAILENDYAFG